MKRIDLEEQKQIELEMLLYVDKICRDNNIVYSLDGGTLIGALRHKGFIPWDDDIDILLLREEYERLIDIIRKDNRYKVFIPGEQDNYFYGFTKIIDKRTVSYNRIEKKLGFPEMGVFIDIFPYDNIPQSKMEYMISQVKKYQKRAIISNKRGTYVYPDKKIKMAIKKVLQYPMHLIYSGKSTAYWIGKAVKEAKSYSKEDIGYVGDFFGNLTMGTGKKVIFPREVFKEYTEALFEGHYFSIIKNYDKYLSKMYGDYMTPPPEEKRVLPHEYEFYWR